MQVYVAMIFLFLFTACSSPQTSKKFELTKEEHVCLEKFFRSFLLQENAVYTLIGSKPLTSASLIYYNISEEQKREQVNQNDEKELVFYKKLFSTKKKEKAYLDIEELWDKWEKIQHRFPLKKRFLLVKKELPKEVWEDVFPEYKAFYKIFFVDILKTALVMQENYELFKQAVGFDFDPMEIVLELENERSHFWGTIRGKDAWKYAHLWGILYGFGKENAFSYCWKNRYMKELHCNEKEKLFALNLQKWSSCKGSPSLDDRHAFSISNFALPIFASFVENDPVVAKYEAEREKIKQLYKGKDFVTFTLDLLTDLEPQTESPFRLEPAAVLEKAS